MNEKNGFLYNTVRLFEKGSANQNQYGNHLWTPELAEMFGAEIGKPFTGRDANGNPAQYNYAFYSDPEVGKQASNHIVDNIWESTKGDSLAFAKQYTGLPEDDPTVQNYAGEINRSKKAQEFEGAVERLNNSKEIEKNKGDLIADIPKAESIVNKAIKNGRQTLEEVKSAIGKLVKDNPEAISETKRLAEETANSFTYGLNALGDNLANGVLWLNGLADEPLPEGAINNIELASDWFEENMDDLYIPELGKEFEWSDFKNPSFYSTKIASQIPQMATLMIPGAKIARAYKGIKGAVMGALAMRPIESFMEASDTYKNLVEGGISKDVAGEEASGVFQKNLTLVGADAVQFGLAFAGVNPAMRKPLSKFIRGIGTVGTVATMEGAEELVQNFFQTQGVASATGQPDPDFMDALLLSTPADKEAFAIGAFFGGTFGAVGQLTKGQVDGIVNEEIEKYKTIKQAKEDQIQKPANEEQAEFSKRVGQLSKYKDKIGLGFSDTAIEDIKSEQELVEVGYDPSQFEDALIKEGEEGYVNDGINRYAVTVQATNYEFEDGTRRVLLSPNATQSDFLEDTAEAVYSRLPEVNQELRGAIDSWLNAVEIEAQNRGESLPYGGAELFSKSLLRSLGYDVALPAYTVIPDNILDAFKSELALDDGTNLIDGMEILEKQAKPTEAIDRSDIRSFAERIANSEDVTSVEDLQFYENNKTEIEKELKFMAREVPTENKQMEMFSMGANAEGGIFVIGGDAIARNVKGERSIEGIRYPEKHNGWQLSVGGATALENQAKAGNDVVIVYQYPKSSSSESNPRFKEALKVALKINNRRVKKNRKTLIELRKEVERSVSEPDINLTRGKVLYVAQFDKVLTGDNRTVKHPTYPAQIVFKNIKELPRPFKIESLTESIDPSISHNARTFIRSRELRATSSNLYLASNESPIVGEIRKFINGKKSTFDERADPNKVFSSYRRKGEVGVTGVFDSINSEREHAYVSALADIAKELGLNGRIAQAGAVTDKYGKENSVVFTAENPDQNKLELYIAYAGLLGNQFSVLHFDPSTGKNDSIYINEFKIKNMDELKSISQELLDKSVDHTVEIRGSNARLIVLDQDGKNFVNFQEKGIIDDSTRTSTGSISFREATDPKLNSEELSDKDKRKIARDYWLSEVERIKELGYQSESGERSYSDLKSKLEKGEGYSLSPTKQKEYAKEFGRTPTRKELRRAKKNERATKPKQLRDIFKTFSSQVNRINPKITQNVVKFQRGEKRLVDEYMKSAIPFATSLKKLKNRAIGRRKKANYVALKLALLNGDSATIQSILSRSAFKQYETWKVAHESMHEKAHAVGIDLGHIETHFPRQVSDYDAFLQYVHGITSSGKKSKLTEAIQDAEALRGRSLTEEEQIALANYIMREVKGLNTVNFADWTKSRKIDVIGLDQLRFYADPNVSLINYGSNMSRMVALAQWLGGKPNRYTLRSIPKGQKIKGVGIFDNKVGVFLRNEDNGLTVYTNRKSSEAIKAIEVLRKDEQVRTGMPYMSMEDQVGGMLMQLQAEHGAFKTIGEETRIRTLFNAYFNKAGMPTLLNGVRNIGYITTMGSVFSAVTQLADLGVSVYRQGQGKFLGYLRPGTYASVLKEMMLSTVRLNKYKLKNLGLDDTILRELNESDTALSRVGRVVFKLTLLKKMDAIGKETLTNTVMKKYEKQAKMAMKGKDNKNTRLMYARLTRKFSGKELNQLVKELASGKVTELTELLAYSELLDVQPVADSELPVGYLRYNDGRRLFYMLKTFALKRLDLFVNEAQILKNEAEALHRAGKHIKAKHKRLQSMYRFLVLGSILAMAEAGADTIKDWMAGRKTPINDLVLSNILKLMMLSRYHYYNFLHSKPSEAIIKMIMMPIDWIDDPARDLFAFNKRIQKYKNSDEMFKRALKDFKKRGAKSIRHIPIVGKHLYWLDMKSDPAKALDKYAPLLAPGYGKRVMKEYEKRNRK